ncbi:hypothetical protein EfmGK923_19360 [Enterococcus faecium]|nr:hypothetical protein EfmGK923_19360 [Enterococcus faecium]
MGWNYSISIYQFIFLISYHVPTGTPGLLARQGFIEHRLFGVYTSPNVGANFGYLLITLIVIFPADFSQSEEEKKKKMVYFNNVFIIIIF